MRPMELRDYAAHIVNTDRLAEKLKPPAALLSDETPAQDAPLPSAPGRPAGLEMIKGVKVPSAVGMRDPAQRKRILHAFANHELQAVELFAWAILAFPQAPTGFRKGLLGILLDEQRHFSLYRERIRALGGHFGAEGVSGYFWNKAAALTTPLKFICAMSLTFESANLDHAIEFRDEAVAAGDLATAEVLTIVHDDELKHVGFGWQWLQKLAPGEDPWDVYRNNLVYPLRPAKGRGRKFQPSSRREAGLPDDFIARVAASE